MSARPVFTWWGSGVIRNWVVSGVEVLEEGEKESEGDVGVL